MLNTHTHIISGITTTTIHTDMMLMIPNIIFQHNITPVYIWVQIWIKPCLK